ncbi:glycosyltransferase [Symbioplanes lichenis]|uniref:glycosyltransferase n=1 Tax=Symbioplanes lichenis TaxID=1629072 RepID=UPI00273989CB|nr:glycosyltransferase [Actinoplanes lichenis]
MTDKLGGSRGDLLVYVASTRYDGPAGTDRHVADELSRLTPVLYVDPPVSALTRLRNPQLAESWKLPPLSVLRPGLARLAPRVTPGMYRPGAHRLVPPLMRRAIRSAAATLYGESRTPVAAMVTTRTEPLLGAVPARRTVFYATDDLVAGAELFGIPRERIVAQEDAVLRRADAVAAVSGPLGDRYAALGVTATVVPTGCDPGAYAGVDTAPVPADATLTGPVAGFVGYVNDRIDLSLLEAVADTGCSLLIVGPVAPGYQAARFSALAGRPNVIHTGPKAFAELPGYLRVIDVGLTPYADTAFNRASFPLKTLEYLAAGRDVVSTPLPANEWLGSSLVTVAAGAADFAAAVRGALGRARTPVLIRQRRELAARHTWTHRAGALARLAGLCQETP